jgi:hypothetical protein
MTPGSITVNKDFKVKNGLNVTDAGTFGGTVTVATPTQNAHATTKLYVDTAISGIVSNVLPTESTAPVSPVDGQVYFDTVTQHLSIYSTDAADWIMIATFDDTANLRQHIHDTAIDGTGLITTVFQDAGAYDDVFSSTQIAGFYDSVEWLTSYDGGSPLDNFN